MRVILLKLRQLFLHDLVGQRDEAVLHHRLLALLGELRATGGQYSEADMRVLAGEAPAPTTFGEGDKVPPIAMANPAHGGGRD